MSVSIADRRVAGPGAGLTPPFPHVLVAVDFTPAGEALVHCLSGLRELGTRTLTLVHVAEVDYPTMGGLAHLEEHRRLLEGMAAELREEGFDVVVQPRFGPTAPEILKAATEGEASLILVGSRSRSRLVGLFIGRVALDVLERSSIPVLLMPIDRAPEGMHPEATALSCHLRTRILFPTDFSAGAAPAAAVVESLVRQGGCRVTLLHALDRDQEADPSPRDEAEFNLESAALRLREAGAVDVDIHLTTGDPADAIAQAAAADPDTLVVMGTQGRGFLGRLLLGSVSRRVAGVTRAPLLLVPLGNTE